LLVENNLSVSLKYFIKILEHKYLFSMNLTMLKKVDPVIFELIEKEKQRQENEIELIASENYASKAVMEAQWSILTNKYSEWYPGRRYYAGQEWIDKIEQLAIQRAKQLFNAEHVNVQPLSGSPANLAVYLALLKPGDTVLGLSLDQWWHLSHGHPLNFSWMLYNVVPYHLNPETELIDMDEVEYLAKKHKPKMILAWFSAYPQNLDWKRFRKIADEVGAILMADIAHIAWLVAWWVLENPVPICDVVTTTTHKTLRWPRWAIIMCKEKYAKDIDRAVFPGVQGWPHEHQIAAKAVAFYEALQPEFKYYAKQVVKNAKELAEWLKNTGFRIVTWWTSNHIVLVDVFSSFWIAWKEAEKALEIVGLSTNKNMIPYDKRKPLDPSWIRLGTAAATTRGMKELEMRIIANIFTRTLKALKDAKWYESLPEAKSDMEIFNNQKFLWKLKELRQEVLQLCKKFPVYKD
jgi:glycine hydroxymethyltransferase